VNDAPTPEDDTSPFRRAPKEPLIQRRVPVSKELPHYKPSTARRDLTAALTVAAVAIPSAMAYAEVAGLSPVIGLYALLLPSAAYALLGSSRQLIVGPEGSLAALVAASVLSLAAHGSPKAAELAATLALLTAACYGIAALVKLGWIADYFSRPVLVGYMHGIAAVLIIGQLGKLLGLDIQASNPIPQLVEVGREIGESNWQTMLISLVSLGVLLPLRDVAPRVPAALIVVAGGIALSWTLDLNEHGVAVVGHIPRGLPSLAVPTPSLGDALQLVPAAAGLFLVSFADEILTARSYAGMHHQHVSAGQELLAMGAANAAAGITQGMPVAASGSRTAVNDAMGSRSQLAGLTAAGVVIVVLLFLTGPIAHLPKAVLGAAIVSAAIGLVNPSAWRALSASDHVELAIAAVTTAGVILAGVLDAITFAVGLSIVDVVRRSAWPHDAVLGWDERLERYADVSVHREARITPGVVVYRLDDHLFFANASYVKGRVSEAIRGAATETRWLVLDAEGVGHVDSAGLEALAQIGESLERDGIGLAVARMKSPIEKQLREGGVVEKIGRERFYGTVQAAIQACVASGVKVPEVEGSS
jgi:SulP family sulfate permease